MITQKTVVTNRAGAALLLCGSLAVLSLLSPAAQASIIPIGSSYTFMGTNAPDNFTATTTFSSTPVLVDNGALTLSEEQVSTGPTGEWDVFNMSTTNGGPLAADIDADWEITIDYVLSAPASFDGVASQWTVNGTPVSPIFNFSGICCVASSNPILPGAAYYNTGFEDPLPAGTQTDWNEIYADPYSIISEGGMDPSTANGYTWALHFTLLQPVPEPTSALLLGAGLLALGLCRRKAEGKR
jgi:hypothetical protein